MGESRSALRLLANFIFRTERKSLAIRAIIFTAAARLMVRFLPGSKLHKHLGIKGEETAAEDFSPAARENISWVKKKVNWAARRLPWENKCLVRAMVAGRLLRGYGVPSTLYLGVGKDENNAAMIAHAWVRCGRYFICGGDGKNYVIVACFAMHPRNGTFHRLGKSAYSEERKSLR